MRFHAGVGISAFHSGGTYGDKQTGAVPHHIGSFRSLRHGNPARSGRLGYRSRIGWRHYTEVPQGRLQGTFRRRCYLHDQCTGKVVCALPPAQALVKVACTFQNPQA